LPPVKFGLINDVQSISLVLPMQAEDIPTSTETEDAVEKEVFDCLFRWS
jgi:hypothetical protein